VHPTLGGGRHYFTITVLFVGLSNNIKLVTIKRRFHLEDLVQDPSETNSGRRTPLLLQLLSYL
jgi:hypothetical protein